MLVLYGVAILLSAALLFLVEPMAGKMLLPLLGGAPAVWNTCMVFFQAGLLLGYAYAHVLTRRFEPRVQAAVHGGVIALPLLLLPVGLRAGGAPPSEGSPVLWTFGALAAAVGAPFLVLSGTGPLLQRWFAMTRHREAGDPYFLYAASNLGSLGGLLAYPLLVEPLLPLGAAGGGTWGWTQSGLWSVGYVVFVLLGGVCAAAMLRSRRGRGEDGEERGRPRGATVSGGEWGERLRWVVYAFVPSSVMLGATQYMAADLASIPLLWVVPLAVYLLTFTLAFARKPWIPLPWSSLGLALFSIAAAGTFWGFSRPYAWMLPLHPLVVLAAGLVCHGRLAAERPPAERLTEYYLMVAFGGVMGGVFNALLAPVLFEKVGVIEYPLALLLAALLRPAARAKTRRPAHLVRALDLALPAALGLIVYGLRLALSAHPIESDWIVVAIQVGIPCALSLFLISSPLRFALGLVVLLAAGWMQSVRPQETLYQVRSFFGMHRVVRRMSDPFQETLADGRTRVFTVPRNILYHGSTRHGLQSRDPQLATIPTSYFHPSGPIGEVFRTFGSMPRLDRVALVGLGAGTITAYGRPGQRITCYELDPEVVRIARDSGYFTYIRDSKAELDYVVGDGRLSLARARDGTYGLVIVDAFNSDAIPLHLLTRQAFELYLRKLRPDGLLAVHITNQYLDLEPVVDAISADLGLAGLVKSVEVTTPEEFLEAKDRSTWAVVARERSSLWPLNRDSTWIVLPLALGGANRKRYLWTDDYSNILSVLRP